MRARSISILAAVFSAAASFAALTAALSLPLHAQQPANPAGASPSATIPADIQTKLYTLQADRKAAQDKGDAKAEATALNGIGEAYFGISEYQKAEDDYRQALTHARAAKDAQQAVTALNGIGSCYRQLSENQKAMEAYQQALDLATSTGDARGQAAALNGIGGVDYSLGESRKGLELYNRALALAQRVGDLDLEATIVNRMGGVNDDLGESEKALELYNQALSLWRAAGDRVGEANTLNNIGIVYAERGEAQKALEYYNQALPLRRAAGDRAGVAGTLNNIGVLYKGLGEKQKALDYYQQALPVQRALGNRRGEASALINIGVVYSDLGENEKALEVYNQALALWRAAGNRSGEAKALNGIGVVYDDLGQKQKALEYYAQALPLATEVGDPLRKAQIFHNLMLSQKVQQPTLAIFYGKQAVNFVQQVRGYIQGLDKELQKSFLSSKNDYYHDLVNLLIDQGRLPEAQQVLDLLKQQEYTDYVRGDTPKKSAPLSLTPAERQAEEDYQKSTAQLVSLGEQWSELKEIKVRTPEQEQRYQQLDGALTKASQGLNDYYSRLYTLFGKNSDANKQVAQVQGDAALLQQEIAAMPHTVALYTMVSKDRYNVIVIAGSMVGKRVEGTIVGREYDISEKDLNQKVQAFREMLRDPAQDPKPLAQELYKILIGPVKADLDQAQAQTLVWSLDGVLRYIPMAALYDGKQYLVENYNIVAFTPASIRHLADKPDLDNMSAVAMGISRKYEDLDPLPTVAGELKDVVNDPQVKDAHGVLPGSILLDGQFTEKALEDALDNDHAVVHIASHFVLQPGDDSQSYLLLAGKEKEGAGYHLTVAEFRNEKKLNLNATDLLTLSACETGVSSNAGNGREVDGLATTAQLKGAGAVISSLWEVNDSSTGDLMADFYKRWADGNGKVMKVEALRLAQLDMLSGKIKPKPNFADPNAATSFAHPYYWAPFTLMGNWR